MRHFAKRRRGCATLAGIVSATLAAQALAQPTHTSLAPPSNRNALRRLAEGLEPDMRGQSDRLSQYVRAYRDALANDPRLFAFDVVASVVDGKPVLEGYVEFPETRRGLEGLLRELGFSEIDNHVETLPDPRLGERNVGLVVAPHAFCYDVPTGKRSVVTECLVGEPVFLLRVQDGCYLVHSVEGYLGFINVQDVRRVAVDEFRAYLDAPAIRLVADVPLGDKILPAGARLKCERRGDDSATVELPNGEQGEVPLAATQPTAAPEETVEAAIASGKRLLGTPYQWGGRTKAGIDCSGLVQLSYATVGVNLARDSNQQYLSGALVATRWNRDGLRRGDTLYFLGEFGRIRHTAIYLGEGRFLQAEMPVVTISSFNQGDPDYEASRDKSFAFGKRLLQ
ncbi:MAG: C40 family peptidase [Planctomycetales bacterium]|nr:C40 family peptidase [Planctomycetales bacterium]